MANKAIRGITVEIGGDTTKLGKALEDSEKHSRSLQTELRQVEKLLKFDPGNVDLLNQKQKILADTISETSKKLDTLKEAEKQVIAQFQKGDIGEEQLRAFQREIMQTEKELDGMQDELKDTEKALGNLKKTQQDAIKETKEYKDAVADAKEAVSDFKDQASGAFDAIKTGAGAVAGAAVAVGGYALNLSTDFDKAFNTLVTKTGATSDEFDELNESMEAVYANNFGDSIEDVAESMATVRTNTKLTGEELQKTTEYAILMRDTFGYEVNESTRSAKMMMDQFGLSAEEAYEFITIGAQNGLDKNGDLLDTINEYSVHFQQLGLGAGDMFSMLIEGAENGTFSVDKLGDAVKEFGIRAKDGSDSSREAFEYLGYDADAMFETFNKGGKDAAEMTKIIMTELADMPDSVEKTTAGVALFGTMWEDLGANGIAALAGLNTELDDGRDRLAELNEIKYDDIGSALQGLGRELETDVIKPLGEELKPVVEEAIGYVKENGPQIKDVLSQIVTKIGEFVGFIVNNGPTILSVIAGIAAGFVAWKAVSIVSSAISLVTSFIGVLKTGTTVMGALNAVMNLNPIGLIITAVVGLVAAFVTLWNTSDEFRNFWINLWEKIKEIFGVAVDAIVNFFTVTLPNAFSNFVTFIGGIVDSIVNFFTVTIPTAWTNFLTTCSNFINSIVTFFSELPGKIWNFLVSVVTKIGEWGANLYNSAVTAVQNAITAVVKFFSELPYKIGYAIGFVIGKLIEWGQNIIIWVTTELPLIIGKIVSFFKELPGKIWNAIVSAVEKIAEWGRKIKEKATTLIKETVSAVVNFMAELPGKIWNVILSAVDKVATWGNNVKTKATTAIKNMVSSVVSTAKELPGKIWNAIKGAIDKVTTWGSNMLSKAKSAIKKVASAITDGLKSVPSKIADIGRNIVEGLWNGIKNATSWIKDKVSSFASGILDGMKDALGINSPSKVFADVVGKAIPEGVAKGVDDNSGLAVDSVEDMADELSGQAVNLNGATLNRRLGATFGAKAANTSNDSALLSRLDNIYEKLGRLQIVLDTGTLVGETVDQIDAALGSNYALKARGV